MKCRIHGFSGIIVMMGIARTMQFCVFKNRNLMTTESRIFLLQDSHTVWNGSISKKYLSCTLRH
jgi:hypothetical protein